MQSESYWWNKNDSLFLLIDFYGISMHHMHSYVGRTAITITNNNEVERRITGNNDDTAMRTAPESPKNVY